MAAFDLSLGPILLGTMVNVWLYGILVTQTAMYYTTFKSDHAWVKVLVAWLFFIDTLNTVFDIGLVWRYTITFFGNLEQIVHSHWLFNVEPVMTTMISSSTQCFYAWRITRLTGHAWMGWVISFLAFLQLVSGLVTTIWASILGDFARFQEGKSIVITWLGLSALIDVLITYVLTRHLHTHRSGFPRTDDVITKLIRSTVQTGLITTVWATVDLIVFLTLANNLHLFLQLPLCKLYTTSLMATLNARAGWGGNFAMGDNDESTLRSGANSRSKPEPGLVWSHAQSTNTTTVQITTTATVHRDDDFELDHYATDDFKRTRSGDLEEYPQAGTVVDLSNTKSRTSGSMHSRSQSGLK